MINYVIYYKERKKKQYKNLFFKLLNLFIYYHIKYMRIKKYNNSIIQIDNL